MRALKFNLSGKTAFFKIPEVNSYCYYTYSCIHKVALLGILGAIMGYGGYSQQKGNDYPEFYEKLSDLKIAILPEKIQTKKKIQTFNNSVGYASQEMGGNLIVRQQWLEDPSWTIYVLIDSDVTKQIAEQICSNQCVYIPYLGSNDHPASISNPCMVEIEEANEYEHIDSLYKAQLEKEQEQVSYDLWNQYLEALPIGLSKETNMYLLEYMKLTDQTGIKYQEKVYQEDQKTFVFI